MKQQIFNKILYLLTMLIVNVVCLVIFLFVARRFPRLQAVNYRGERIPTAAGIGLLAGYLVAMVAGVCLGRVQVNRASLLAASAFWFALLGLMDDLWGTRDVKGLSGHFRSLLWQRRLTTGAVKAIGGVAGAFVLSLFGRGIKPRPTLSIAGGNFWCLLLGTALIPLCANAFNLLDCRPSRALKGFWVLALLSSLVAMQHPTVSHSTINHLTINHLTINHLTINHLTINNNNNNNSIINHHLAPVLPLIMGSFIYAPFDFRCLAMLGDVGSNMLGGVLGAFIVQHTPIFFQVVLTFAFLLFHTYAERRSLTADIERIRWLRFIDRLGVRAEVETKQPTMNK